MAKTVAQRQAAFRKRWPYPRTYQGMQELLLAAYELGRIEAILKQPIPPMAELEQRIAQRMKPLEEPTE